MLDPDWKNLLNEELKAPYMQELKKFLQTEQGAKKRIYPRNGLIFNAFDLSPLKKVKVVIIGQDPYHTPGQAHGLCFSIQPGRPFQPSLMNIFKELNRDLGVPIPQSGDLSNWAQQGVLLLNTVLTVEEGKPGSHQGKGWEKFTDKIISLLSEKREHLVFILWGSFAQKKEVLIDKKKHLILKSPHPSPLSAHRGFLGNGHFSKVNEYLVKTGQTPINWDPSFSPSAH